MPVAAAASVPYSFTSTKALWASAEMKSYLVPAIPEKSAFLSREADFMPRAVRQNEIGRRTRRSAEEAALPR